MNYDENEKLRREMTDDNEDADGPVISSVRIVDHRCARTEFFTVEYLPGTTDLMQEQSGYPIGEQILQAMENLKRWDKGERLLNVCEVLDLHTQKHPVTWKEIQPFLEQIEPIIFNADGSFNCTIEYDSNSFKKME